MNTLLSILRSRNFWIGITVIFGVQLGILFATTPLYEIDTNAYIQGAFSWSIYHNPLMNFFIGGVSKIWKNIYFMLGIQLFFFGFSASFLAKVLFKEGRRFAIAIGIASIEPISMFYNFSVLSESFFASFLMLSMALLVLYFRNKSMKMAFLFGAMLGMMFLTRLAALPLIALCALFLLPWGNSFLDRITTTVAAILPFLVCYLFVQIGQQQINRSPLYSAKGIALWNFASSAYVPEEIEGEYFKKVWNPHIFRDGTLPQDRILRRDLSYLGYKDCLADQENTGKSPAQSVLYCDSIFRSAALQIIQQHPLEVELQFIKDNLNSVATQSYLDYRFTPGLPFYHAEKEYAYIDSLMQVHYGIDLSQRVDDIPEIWKNLSFSNGYMGVLYAMYWGALFLTLGLWLKNRNRTTLLVIGAVLLIPIAFHLLLISFRLRFLAPYLITMLYLWIGLVLGTNEK